MARKAGSKNLKTTKEGTLLASLARQHTEAALKTLLDLMLTAEESSVRKSAADSILDRGWGKPAQAILELDDTAKKTVFGWLPIQN